MTKQIVIVAPHPDDETLGCGGTILRHSAEGDAVHWLIATTLPVGNDAFRKRKSEIDEVAHRYGFSSVHNLSFPTTNLDTIAMGELISGISAVFSKVVPDTVYVPYRGDIHTDHAIVFDAVASSTKCFRLNSVKRILAYETLSETDYGINPDLNGFRPNVFVDISGYLETKIEIMRLYSGELADFPFPRSEQAMRCLAALRGAAAGCQAAEAFMLLKEII